MTVLVLALSTCAIWLYLLLARGGFWRADERDDASHKRADVLEWPTLVAVMPARDEADVIGESVGSLLRQNYPAAFALIVVDDHSSDATAACAVSAAAAAHAADRLVVLSAPDLRPGWTGKLWSLNHGVTRAGNADYLLLTDAAIHSAADTVERLVVRAVRDVLVLASLMARLHCTSFAERALIPSFVFFFQMLYPFAWVNGRNRTTSAAAGGCMLVSRKALEAVGGFSAVRNELIDDCALARLLKRHGPIWLGLTECVESVRSYRTVGDIRRMVARTAYTQLGHSPWLLAGAVAAMVLTFIVPVGLAVFSTGMPRTLGLLAWALMTLAFQPILAFYRLSPLWGMALPAIAATYVAFTLDSAFQAVRGRGGMWKGRAYRPARRS
jgi:hopene-associated glycosyltransferase HpnB